MALDAPPPIPALEDSESLQTTYLDVLGSDAHPHRVRSRFLGRVGNAVGSVAVVQHRRLGLAGGGGVGRSTQPVSVRPPSAGEASPWQHSPVLLALVHDAHHDVFAASGHPLPGRVPTHHQEVSPLALPGRVQVWKETPRGWRRE